ncbi:hypothetical protein ACLB2K_043407 [Fragaria x ananassa]
MQLASLHVAVLGAGAAGLVAALELRREGHKVVVFERGDQVGGTWVYTPEVESDPFGLDPDRTRVHSSMYQSLRTTSQERSWGSETSHLLPRKEMKMEIREDFRVTEKC